MGNGSRLGPVGAPATIVLNTPHAVRRVLYCPNEIGFARAFVLGEADFEGDALAALRAFVDAVPDELRMVLKQALEYHLLNLERKRLLDEVRQKNAQLVAANADLLRANERRVTIDEIQKRVAEHFNIKLAEMTSSRRARIVARPRQVAMYLAKQLTSRSLPEIGRKFGGRDHTTVIHAVKKIEELSASDTALAEDVELLRRMLQS